MNNHLSYPAQLQPLFEKLYTHGAYPIIVGGFVRDLLLNIPSKDIDIEVYQINSYKELEEILKTFGSVCTVGKSFGVCKLILDDLDLDFTLPRLEKKIAAGHKGFEIFIDTDLCFKEASLRRDFTINAIGYDIINKKILDPFGGQEDLTKKILRVVDPKTFVQDPLRVMRAIQFCARFELHIEQELFSLCQDMIEQKQLEELPSQRVFEELKKLLLQAKKPSLGLLLLRDLKPFKYFYPLNAIALTDYQDLIKHIDYLASLAHKDQHKKLIVALAVLLYFLKDQKTQEDFLQTLTQQKDIQKDVFDLLTHLQDLESLIHNNYIHYDLYKLATKVALSDLLFFTMVLRYNNPHLLQGLLQIQQKAHELHILSQPLQPLLQGRDLLSFDLKPSKKFKKILQDAYEAQMREVFHTYQEALLWLQKYLLTIK